MKRFHFPLEPALALRRRQLETEEAQLFGLYREKENCLQARAALAAERASEDRLLESAGSLDAASLAALDSFHAYATRQDRALAAMIADCQRRIAEQLSRVMEARRKLELIERLRGKRVRQWEAEAAKETDALAQESHLARWARERR